MHCRHLFGFSSSSAVIYRARAWNDYFILFNGHSAKLYNIDGDIFLSESISGQCTYRRSLHVNDIHCLGHFNSASANEIIWMSATPLEQVVTIKWRKKRTRQDNRFISVHYFFFGFVSFRICFFFRFTTTTCKRRPRHRLAAAEERKRGRERNKNEIKINTNGRASIKCVRGERSCRWPASASHPEPGYGMQSVAETLQRAALVWTSIFIAFDFDSPFFSFFFCVFCTPQPIRFVFILELLSPLITIRIENRNEETENKINISSATHSNGR